MLNVRILLSLVTIKKWHRISFHIKRLIRESLMLERIIGYFEPHLKDSRVGKSLLHYFLYLKERCGLEQNAKILVRKHPDLKEIEPILDSLIKHGYAKIENFFSPKECELAISEIDRVILEFPDKVNIKSDKRVFNINQKSKFLEHYRNIEIGATCCQMLWGVPTLSAFTLGARLEYFEGNFGSGEGWHRDTFNFMFKTILYLTDVEVENGPFEYIEYSHSKNQFIKDIYRADLDYGNTRITDEKVAEILSVSPKRLKTFVAKAGTLLLANTSGIHRGKPIENGVRYALTNYYYRKVQMGEWMNHHFNPVAPIFVGSNKDI